MAITSEQSTAIAEFLAAAAKLRRLGVIQSDRYLGDLGEFLATKEYDLELAVSQRQRGYDTKGDENRGQIKFHNSAKRTNLILGSPDEYDRVIVVLGPDSLLHPQGMHAGAYCFYEFSSEHVREHFARARGFSCGKRHFGQPQRVCRLSGDGAA